MPFGGRQPGAGRPPGAKSKHVIERELRAKQGLAAALDGGLLPLDVMLCRMRGQPLPNGTMPTDEQVAAAIAAAPYLHPRLSSTDATVRADNVCRIVSDRPLTLEEWQEKFASTPTTR